MRLHRKTAAVGKRPQPDDQRAERAAMFPPWLLLPAAAGAAFILIPLAAVFAGVPWDEFWGLVTSAEALTALGLSLRTAAAATVLCVLLGLPLALLLTRMRFPGDGVVRALVLVPMVLPPVVSGVALLHAFGRKGLVGGTLELFGVSVAYSTAAVVIAQAFVSLPFLIITVEQALRSLDPEVIEAAVMDGAQRTQVLRFMVLPLIKSGLLAGIILAFARSLGEFGATIAFAGSLQGVTRTLPLEIYLQRETDPDAALALSLLLILVAAVVVGTGGSARLRGRSSTRA